MGQGYDARRQGISQRPWHWIGPGDGAGCVSASHTSLVNVAAAIRAGPSGCGDSSVQERPRGAPAPKGCIAGVFAGARQQLDEVNHAAQSRDDGLRPWRTMDPLERLTSLGLN